MKKEKIQHEITSTTKEIIQSRDVVNMYEVILCMRLLLAKQSILFYNKLYF